jgi:DNA-binding CsgD family transcriptional regulator
MAEKISARLQQVLELAALGHTDKEIAQELGLAVSTISSHWKEIRRRFESSSRTEIVARMIARKQEASTISAQERDQLLFEAAERKRIEEELVLANERLDQALREQHDIMVKITAEQEQRYVEMRLRLEHLEAVNEIMVEFGIMPNIGEHGASWRKILVPDTLRNFGYEPDDIVAGKVTVFGTVVPEDLASRFYEYERQKHTGKVLLATRLVCADGSYRNILGLCHLDPPNEDNIGKGRFVSIDITEWVDELKEFISRGWPNLPLQLPDSPK